MSKARATQRTSAEAMSTSPIPFNFVLEAQP
jgi:hypothetical protein